MTTSYNGRVTNAIHNDHKDFGIVWNQSLQTIDSWVILKNSPNKDAAYKLLEFASRGEVQAALPAFQPIGITAASALSKLDPRCSPTSRPPRTMPGRCSRSTTPSGTTTRRADGALDELVGEVGGHGDDAARPRDGPGRLCSPRRCCCSSPSPSWCRSAWWPGAASPIPSSARRCRRPPASSPPGTGAACRRTRPSPPSAAS